MHFQEIKDEYYEKELAKNLLVTFPELTAHFDYETTIYHMMGVFGTFFIEKVEDSKIYEKAIRFINYSFEKGSHKTKDIFIVEVFEEASQDFLIIEKMNADLSGKALDVFKEYLLETR